MLIDLDDPKPSVIIFIEHGLNAGGFSGSAVTEQQDVIGSPPA